MAAEDATFGTEMRGYKRDEVDQRAAGVCGGT